MIRTVKQAVQLATMLLALNVFLLGHAFAAPKKETPPKPGFNMQAPLYLDARSMFDYTMGHHQGAQHIRWEDFSQSEPEKKGLLDPDHERIARRLTALGVHPDRVTFVIGAGSKGWGEEGRIAWMLQYLGVKDVRIANYGTFDGKKKFGEKPNSLSAPTWKPQINESLRATKDEVKNAVSSKDKSVTLIDVREPEEFKGEKTFGEQRAGHIPGSINIPWKNFINEQGNVKNPADVEQVLKKHNIDTRTRLIFYCTGGVRSAYATFAANKASLNAADYDGSLWEWAADDNLPLEK